MSSTPKIVVIKTREVIYTLLLLALALLLILCLVLMFFGKKAGDTAQSASASSASYVPGVYTASVTLGDSAVDVEVVVDSSSIHSIRLVNLSETTEAAFPLVSPALDHIAEQILEKQSLEDITCPQENRYTSQLLFNAIAQALALATQ